MPNRSAKLCSSLFYTGLSVLLLCSSVSWAIEPVSQDELSSTAGRAASPSLLEMSVNPKIRYVLARDGDRLQDLTAEQRDALRDLLKSDRFRKFVSRYKKLPPQKALALAIDGEKVATGLRSGLVGAIPRAETEALATCEKDRKIKGVASGCFVFLSGSDYSSIDHLSSETLESIANEIECRNMTSKQSKTTEWQVPIHDKVGELQTAGDC